jgi:hypothetical protein
VAHAYTPGLRVTERAVLRRERRLPLQGDVVVGVGHHVAPDTVVARTELPGDVQIVNVAAQLSLDPAAVPAALLAPVGSAVRKGDAIAGGRSLFGLVKNTVHAPANGRIESVSPVSGQLILREPPVPVEVNAYVRGVVCDVLPGEGVVVETRGAFLQGIFGVGGETHGELAIATSGPEEELTEARLEPSHRGRVVVGGSRVSHGTLMRAKEIGVAAVVAGGLDDRDLRLLLGKDLGVAITGSEELGFTLVLTEGFGRIPMAARTWRLLTAHRGEHASVSGATQIRAGVMRPEIIIPGEGSGLGSETDLSTGLEIGSLLRVIREPHFGRIGRVVDLPSELQPLETESGARVLVVEFADDAARAVVPRANVELISG